MLREWEKKYPGRIDSIFGALGNVVPSHLMDRALFDFAAVAPTGVPTTGRRHRVRRRPGARARGRRCCGESRLPDRRHRHPARVRRLTSPCRPGRSAARSTPSALATSLAAFSRLAGGIARRAFAAARRAVDARARRRRSRARASLAALRAGGLRPLLPAHGDGLQPERRADDGLRGLREPAQPHRRGTRRRARDRRRDPLARHSDRRSAREPVLPHARNRGADLRPRHGLALRCAAAPRNADRRTLRRAQGFCSRGASPGKVNLAIASHGNPFAAVAGTPYLAEGEVAVIEPRGTRGFRVVARIRKDEWTALK